MSIVSYPFWDGFYKKAAMNKGERADRSTGVKPRTLVSSKGRFSPEPLPSADDDSSVRQHLRADLKLKELPKK